MLLLERYDQEIASGDIVEDPAQRVVLGHLQRIAEDLAIWQAKWGRKYRKNPIQGLYLYGPVGGGKTYLVDLFYDNVTIKEKARFHFHHFMQQVDAALRRLQGRRDPIKLIAAQLAKTTRLLCFDEFLVFDVADAMILSELLQALLAYDVVLVATSNTPPDALYYNGVQRDRFLPAIALIKQSCEVLALDELRDYRLGRALLQDSYFYPLDENTAQHLTQQFAKVAGSIEEGNTLTVQKRTIPCVKYSEHAAWFKFDDICNMPRSQLDYLELADRFDTLFVSDIPLLTPQDTVRVLLLIHFIDVMYDRSVYVVISAAGPLDALYETGPLHRAFQRTLSRMKEMRSSDYLNRHHRRPAQILLGDKE